MEGAKLFFLSTGTRIMLLKVKGSSMLLFLKAQGLKDSLLDVERHKSFFSQKYRDYRYFCLWIF